MTEKRYEDVTVIAVLVNRVWFPVLQGTWEVFEGGEFERATWKSLHGKKYSAFLKYVEMVEYEA